MNCFGRTTSNKERFKLKAFFKKPQQKETEPEAIKPNAPDKFVNKSHGASNTKIKRKCYYYWVDSDKGKKHIRMFSKPQHIGKAYINGTKILYIVGIRTRREASWLERYRRY
jgi:hypothetical protein